MGLFAICWWCRCWGRQMWYFLANAASGWQHCGKKKCPCLKKKKDGGSGRFFATSKSYSAQTCNEEVQKFFFFMDPLMSFYGKCANQTPHQISVCWRNSATITIPPNDLVNWFSESLLRQLHQTRAGRRCIMKNMMSWYWVCFWMLSI